MTEEHPASEKLPAAAPATTHVQVSVDLPKGETVRVTIESLGGPGEVQTHTEHLEVRAAPPPWRVKEGSSERFRRATTGTVSAVSSLFRDSGQTLFYIALILYLASRLIGLSNWPIYFFTDEAVQTNFTAELWDSQLKWHNGEILPTFFENAGQYEMNFSVYVQLLPYLLFGKSVLVTRGISVLVTLMGMAAIGLILKKAFRLPQWWSGVLVLSIIPAWFLDSRTAFESAEAVALYAVFLLFYVYYRTDKPIYLFPMLFFGALAAYTYSPAQMIMLVTGVLLLISDIRYHLRFIWQHRIVALLGLIFTVILALPYIRFLIAHPTANRDQLVIVGSLWIRDIPWTEKIGLYLAELFKGFDPRYWFLANPPEGVYQDIIRHLMKGYGHIFLWYLPFALVGLLLCLWNIRRWQFRAVLISLLAAPSGAALAQITITRAMFVVFPVAILTTLGIVGLLSLFDRQAEGLPDYLEIWRERLRRFMAWIASAWRARRESWNRMASESRPRTVGLARVPRIALSLGLFLVLAFINIYMVWDALANGPTWYTNYTLYGMQYGGEQLSAALVEYKQQYPDADLVVSTSWANGTDELFRFFLPKDFSMRTGTIEAYEQEVLPIGENTVFVMTAEEYGKAVASERFAGVTVEQTLPYPDGQPGFYFARIRYADNIQQIIADEKAAQAKPVEETLALDGETLTIIHSRFDMGSIAVAFDGNLFSLMRTQTANPMMLEFLFPQPHRFTAVRVRVGGGPTRVTATFYPEDGGEPTVYSAEVERSSDYRTLEIKLPDPLESRRVKLEIETVGEGEPNHVHVYEIELEGVGWKSGRAAPPP